MNIDQLIAQTRSIMKTRYESMKQMDMGDSDPEITKEDLCKQLHSFIPEATPESLRPLYEALEEKGHATLITNDTVTFSKSFVGA